MKLTLVALAVRAFLDQLRMEALIRERTRQRVRIYLEEAATIEERQWRKMALHASLYGAGPEQVLALLQKGEKNEG